LSPCWGGKTGKQAAAEGRANHTAKPVGCQRVVSNKQLTIFYKICAENLIKCLLLFFMGYFFKNKQTAGKPD